MTSNPDPLSSSPRSRIPASDSSARRSGGSRGIALWALGLLVTGLGACRSVSEPETSVDGGSRVDSRGASAASDRAGSQDSGSQDSGPQKAGPLEAASRGVAARAAGDTATLPEVVAPLELTTRAADFAATVSIPAAAPTDGHGLLNVYFLSDNVISGSEPHGFEALEELRDLGVRTILSVDGKAPDVDDAASLGMRYVHVPIQYRGITDDQLLRIAKSFRELEGPFYVHCFHGKHRGPAAAAVGRVVLDGADREVAIAEMRQYSGTSTKYEGLYQVVATGDLPAAEETAEYEYGFDPVELPEGMVEGMVQITRSFDNVVFLEGRDWEIDPTHPDLSARNEAQLLAEAFANSAKLQSVLSGPEGQLAGFEEATRESRALVSALDRMQAGDADAAQDASARIDALQALCTSCHSTYRN